MDSVVAQVASTPLDRSRPLWQAWQLQGRRDGRVAVLIKVHHAVADGTAATALLASILSADPDAAAPSGVGLPQAEVVPRPMRLLLDALAGRVAELRRLPMVVRDTRRRVARRRTLLAGLRRAQGIAPPRPMLDTPVTSLNRAITACRAVATATLPLEPMLDAKRAAGVTFNDVLLTVIGGALLRVLEERGEHPRRSLTAGVPVSSDQPVEGGAPERRSGNKVSNLFVSLCTDESDPLRRLHAVHGSTTSAKRLHQELGSDLMETWLEYTPPRGYSWGMRLYSRLSVADHHRAPFNVIVSNVPGPRVPLCADGARLCDFFSSGPVLEGIGVNVTAWSYMDRLDVMVTSCARALPHPEQLTAAMAPQLEELLAGIRSAGSGD